MYNIVWQQKSQNLEERLLILEEILHNMPLRVNTAYEALSDTSQVFVPEPTVLQRDKAQKLHNQQKRKKNQTPT